MNSLHRTSSGVAHKYKPGYYFPDSSYKSHLNDPLPSMLQTKDGIAKDEIYKTSNNISHDNKFLAVEYNNDNINHSKAAGHWKMNYVYGEHSKLVHDSGIKSLSMGNQKSEAQSQFTNKTNEQDLSPKFNGDPKGFNLADHHVEGPSKQIYGNTENDKLKGREFYVKNKGILDLMDPYLTTNMKDHHQFKPKDLEGYAKKDVHTYWQCEDYPKAWGHGVKDSQFQKENLQSREKPMRDHLWFKTAANVKNAPRNLQPVPHSGSLSLQKESYQNPAHVDQKENFYSSVDKPFASSNPHSNMTNAAPNMYTSEYETIGSKKLLIV